MSDAMWKAVKEDLRTRIGQDSFRNWIEQMEFRGLRDNYADFVVPSKFIASWIQNSYGKQICNAFCSQGGKVHQLNFVVEEAEVQSPISQKPKQPANEVVSELPTLPSNPLDPRYKFDRFVVGKSNELAFAAAHRVVSGEGVNFNPLFLYSGVGLGKTHLMHAIAWEITEKFPQKRVLFLSAEQFMYRFVQALRAKNMQNFKEIFRSVDVLLVDDVQFIAGKDSTQDEFFYTFNALVEQNKQIIISADRAPGDLEGIEDRIRSRLQWGLMVDIHPTDFELRLGILQSKAEFQLRDHPHLVLEDGVLEFLAQRISSNVRVLEGSLTRLFAYADLTGKAVSLELAHDILADILRVSKTKLTLDLIIKRTAEFYNIRVSEMIGQRRTQAIARPRQIAMFLAKSLTTKSLPDIGRAFGGRDHTTVIHAVRKIEDLSRHDSEMAEELETLRRKLEA